MASKEVIQLSRDLVDYNHRTAVYYEDKRYRLLWLSTGLVGFTATFMTMFKEHSTGAGIALGLALLSIVAYVVMSTPRTKAVLGKGLRSAGIIDVSKTPEKNLGKYYAAVAGMSASDVLKENTAQALALFYLYKSKIRSIKVMTAFILLSVGVFSVSVLFSL